MGLEGGGVREGDVGTELWRGTRTRRSLSTSTGAQRIAEQPRWVVCTDRILNDAASALEFPSEDSACLDFYFFLNKSNFFYEAEDEQDITGKHTNKLERFSRSVTLYWSAYRGVWKETRKLNGLNVLSACRFDWVNIAGGFWLVWSGDLRCSI